MAVAFGRPRAKLLPRHVSEAIRAVRVCNPSCRWRCKVYSRVVCLSVNMRHAYITSARLTLLVSQDALRVRVLIRSFVNPLSAFDVILPEAQGYASAEGGCWW